MTDGITRRSSMGLLLSHIAAHLFDHLAEFLNFFPEVAVAFRGFAFGRPAFAFFGHRTAFGTTFRSAFAFGSFLRHRGRFAG